MSTGVKTSLSAHLQRTRTGCPDVIAVTVRAITFSRGRDSPSQLWRSSKSSLKNAPQVFDDAAVARMSVSDIRIHTSRGGEPGYRFAHPGYGLAASGFASAFASALATKPLASA